MSYEEQIKAIYANERVYPLGSARHAAHVLHRAFAGQSTPKDLFPPDQMAWAEASLRISDKGYSRSRDRRRAYKRLDLRTARKLDRLTK